MSSADLTRRAVVYGDPDSTTGWLGKSFTEYTVEGSIQPQGYSFGGLTIGGYAKYPQTLFTPDVARIGDEYIDSQGQYYLCKAADQWWRLNQFSHYTCNLQKNPHHYDRPATSGTWHVDSESDKTEPRYRTKSLLGTHLGTVYKDNGSTAATVHFCFDHPDHPLTAFFDKGYHVIGAVSCAPSAPRLTNNHYPYAFDEHVTLNVYTMNQTGLTAPNLLEQVEQAIRHVITDNAVTETDSGAISIRKINSSKPVPVDLEGYILYGFEMDWVYTRENDDYVPTKPTLTWGPSASPTGTFVFPNVTQMTLPNVNADVWKGVPGRVPSIVQGMGSEGLEIQLTVDLDCQHSTLTWMRPQTTSPKTDKNNFQVFLDIMHNAQIDQNYQTLTTDWGAFKVRLIRMEPALDGAENHLTLTFKEYSATNLLGGSVTTRFGIS